MLLAGPLQVNAVSRQLERLGFQVRAVPENGPVGGAWPGLPFLVPPPAEPGRGAGDDYVVTYSCPQEQQRTFTNLQSTFAERLKSDLTKTLGLGEREVRLEQQKDRSWRVVYQTSENRTLRVATLEEANAAQVNLRKLGFKAEVTRDTAPRAPAAP
jgi:hypothetical protein